MSTSTAFTSPMSEITDDPPPQVLQNSKYFVLLSCSLIEEVSITQVLIPALDRFLTTRPDEKIRKDIFLQLGCDVENMDMTGNVFIPINFIDFLKRRKLQVREMFTSGFPQKEGMCHLVASMD